MQKTNIPLADYTWNPTRGCWPASEGCASCYAARMASRFSGPGLPYEGLAKDGKWTGEVMFVHDELDAPKKLRKPSRIFVNSMSDLFHSMVPDWYIKNVLIKMYGAPKQTFILLTKRPERALQITRSSPHPADEFPPNCILGVSVESQKHIGRIDTLLEIPCAKRVVSFEPLLGPIQVSIKRLYGVDWVIAGRETGPRARPFDKYWASQICGKCRFTETPFFYKAGSRTPILNGVRWTQIPEV